MTNHRPLYSMGVLDNIVAQLYSPHAMTTNIALSDFWIYEIEDRLSECKQRHPPTEWMLSHDVTSFTIYPYFVHYLAGQYVYKPMSAGRVLTSSLSTLPYH